jgi:hypothetical protein
MKMNDKLFYGGEFAHSLRCNLYMEHFDMTFEEVQDPLNKKLLKNINQ